MTEAHRVVAMASMHDTLVLPPGSPAYSSHRQQHASKDCPVAGFLNVSPKADAIVPLFGGLFPDETLPKDGFIERDDKPGSGATLQRRRPRRGRRVH
jgi:L-rhamnonate dehydratase